MAKPPRRSETPPYAGVIFADIVAAVFTLAPAVVAWGALAAAAWWLWDTPELGWLLPAAPAVVVTSFLVTLFVLRLLAPRLRAGVYPVGINRGMIAWSCHLALSRAATAAGLHPLLHSFYLLKLLYYRALGAHWSLRINSAQRVTLVDAPLIEVGEGATLAEGVGIYAHTFVGDKLLLKPVHIGRNVFVGAGVLIGPGTSIGDAAWIGLGNRLGSDRVPAGTHIADLEWQHGSPKRQR